MRVSQHNDVKKQTIRAQLTLLKRELNRLIKKLLKDREILFDFELWFLDYYKAEIALILGKEEEAEQIIQELKERLAKFRKELAEIGDL